MSRADSTGWQAGVRVSIDVEALGIPHRSTGRDRTQTESGQQIARFLRLLNEQDILDTSQEPSVGPDGRMLSFKVTQTPGIGPQVHQRKIRAAFQQAIGLVLVFGHNPLPCTAPSARLGSGFGLPSGIEIELWIEF